MLQFDSNKEGSKTLKIGLMIPWEWVFSKPSYCSIFPHRQRRILIRNTREVICSIIE